MAAETKTGFMIDGDIYGIPSWTTFTMDEAQILYDYSGLTIEDLAMPEEEETQADTDKMANPGFVRALLHIAYQRGNQNLSSAKVKKLIGNAQMIDALLPIMEALSDNEPEEDDALPPASTTEREPSSLRSSVASNGSSGEDLKKSSGELDALPARTTTTGSDTSSISPQTSSVA